MLRAWKWRVKHYGLELANAWDGQPLTVSEIYFAGRFRRARPRVADL